MREHSCGDPAVRQPPPVPACSTDGFPLLGNHRPPGPLSPARAEEGEDRERRKTGEILGTGFSGVRGVLVPPGSSTLQEAGEVCFKYS
jgi:hypothetical protein